MCAEDAENEGLARRLGKVSRIPKLTKPTVLLLFFLLFSITQLRSKANLHPEECIRYGQKNFQKSLLFQIWDLEWGLLWVRNGGNTLIFFFFASCFPILCSNPGNSRVLVKMEAVGRCLNLWERASYLWPRNRGPQFSHSVMSNSLWSHGLQHARLSSASPTPRACSPHVHQVGDAIQPSHPLLSPSPAFSLFQ